MSPDRFYQDKINLMKILFKSTEHSDLREELEILNTQRQIRSINVYLRSLNPMVSIENLTSFYLHFLSFPNSQSNDDAEARKYTVL